MKHYERFVQFSAVFRDSFGSTLFLSDFLGGVNISFSRITIGDSNASVPINATNIVSV